MVDFSQDLDSIATALKHKPDAAKSLIEQSLDRFDSVGESLGAYIERDAAKTREQLKKALVNPTKGPLFGIPISAKDLYGVEGFSVRAGTPAELPLEFHQQGPIVQGLRAGGAIITGKTHTVEFAFGGLGTNPHWPTPHNPWDVKEHRVPGGSSSGAGVSLHTDALLALGTDTAGSVRIPAAMTGNVGLKTTFGRWPLSGIVPLSPSLDTAGLLAKTVADLQCGFTAIEAILGLQAPIDTPNLTDIKVGIGHSFFWGTCSEGVAKVVREALRELAVAGVNLTDFTLAEAEPSFALFKLGHLAAPELREFLDTKLPQCKATLDPKVAQRIEDAGDLSAVEYLQRRRILQEFAAKAHQRLLKVDVLATPTVVITPPKVADVTLLDSYRTANLLALRNTCIANMLGLCALTLPVGLDSAGLPVGLQLISCAHNDAKLVKIGLLFEKVLGTGFNLLGETPIK